jgi:hypothetical protein
VKGTTRVKSLIRAIREIRGQKSLSPIEILNSKTKNNPALNHSRTGTECVVSDQLLIHFL